ncbi:hypothetical protein ACPPVO_22735 [Dactylosporangium sp. McL0621]|uniref:hypothetical protein n=1 Tax=Dactylosporangium sp. McL0621 TaxID=3415678 RepID=UPI003CF4A03B
MRLAEGLLYLALVSVGGGLFGFAVVSVGLLRRPTAQRMWGRLGTLPRGRFAAYFGLLGLAWAGAVWLLWFLRGERYTVPLAGIAVLLTVGWVIGILRNRGGAAGAA